MIAATLGTELTITQVQHGTYADKYASQFAIDDNGCWIWEGRQSSTHYGRAGRVFAHRFFYELLVSEIPEGMYLDHLCRVPLCVNPDHLEPVTPRENVLRGVGPAAKNALRTHCKRGHEFTPENTRIRSRGRRVCRECARLEQLARRATDGARN